MRYLTALFIFVCITLTCLGKTPSTREYQNGRDYVRALDEALKLYQAKKLSSLEFEDVFFPKGEMQFFLSYNFDDPEVVSLLARIQEAQVSDAVGSNIGAIISGRRKEMDISIRKNHPELAKPVPLLKGGYAPEDPLPNVAPDPMSAPMWRSENSDATPPPGMLKPHLHGKPSDSAFHSTQSDVEQISEKPFFYKWLTFGLISLLVLAVGIAALRGRRH